MNELRISVSFEVRVAIVRTVFFFFFYDSGRIFVIFFFFLTLIILRTNVSLFVWMFDFVEILDINN